MIKQVKYTVTWACIVSDLNGEKNETILKHFMKKNCKNQIKKTLE